MATHDDRLFRLSRRDAMRLLGVGAAGAESASRPVAAPLPHPSRRWRKKRRRRPPRSSFRRAPSSARCTRTFRRTPSGMGPRCFTNTWRPISPAAGGAARARDRPAAAADERRDGRPAGRGAADGRLRRRQLHHRLLDRAALGAAAGQPPGHGDPRQPEDRAGRLLLPGVALPGRACRHVPGGDSPRAWWRRRSGSAGVRSARLAARSRRCTTSSAR